jgi:hypothetical protein
VKSKNRAGYNLVGESMGFSLLKSTRCNIFQVRGMPVKRETDMKPGMKRKVKRGDAKQSQTELAISILFWVIMLMTYMYHHSHKTQPNHSTSKVDQVEIISMVQDSMKKYNDGVSAMNSQRNTCSQNKLFCFSQLGYSASSSLDDLFFAVA